LSKIQSSQEKLAQRINKEYMRIAEKLGLGYDYMGLEQIGPFSGGSFGRLNHKFTSRYAPDIFTDTNIITFTSHGLAKAMVSESLKCFCAVYVEKPAPCTIYVKQIRDGFRKKPIWVPFHRSVKASEVYKNRMSWNGLLEALNNDDALAGYMNKMETETNIHGIDQHLSVGRGKSFPVCVNDADNNHGTRCMIVPVGDRTFVASQHVNDNPRNIEPALQAVKRIAEIIHQYNYQQFTTGEVISDYAKDLMELMGKKRKTKPTSAASKPQAVASGKKCPQCGYINLEKNKFCGECGASLKLKKGVCPKCGTENPPENKFCGECGTPLSEFQQEIPKSRQTPPPPPPPTKPSSPGVNVSDPLEQLITGIKGGADVQWTIRYKTTKQEYEGKLWNIAHKGYFVRNDNLMAVAEKINQQNHYLLFPNIRYVKTPNDKTLTGGFMNFAMTFNNKAPEPFRKKNVQVLLLPRDENPAEASVRMLASTDKEMTPDRFSVMLDVLVNNPGGVKEFYLWGIQD